MPYFEYQSMVTAEENFLHFDERQNSVCGEVPISKEALTSAPKQKGQMYGNEVPNWRFVCSDFWLNYLKFCKWLILYASVYMHAFHKNLLTP